jgi:dTDP-4-dehydrorhamnose reductase
LVIGGSGLLGGKIVMRLMEAGHSTSYSYFGNDILVPGANGYPLDLTDGESLIKLVRKTKPDLIVNSAALPSVDQCDKDKTLGFKVNAEPQKIISETVGTATTIAFISTSNVFGFSKIPFKEDDAPDPVSTYGETKLLGERYTLTHKRHLILRSDQIYGWTTKGQKKTFVERCLEKLERNEPVEVCSDWYNCPTYADDVAIALVRLVTGSHFGIFHSVGPTYLNRVEWAKRIAKAFGHDPGLVKAIDSSILNLPAKRSNCALDNEKIVRTSGHRFLSVDEGLERMKIARNTQHP